ncbi:carbohydrate kinase family protein [Paludisphaera mucosa]|uniref:Carbohydrate kinase family protein n=1 Tax=Paludisphaera mucosa TaxID=3030827 RepID=A0ABT6F4Y0_9BACT|nr:carbohydrate kinase family protein [Paludisphaera mucosa]MDG3002561.1 carbohydrate kinase family protein [Paludisphaera mucosa]
MRVFVTGSIAYDYIMVFPGKFRDHILADKVHVLSVSFLVDSLTRRRGGTGANIAYNLALLGEKPVLVGTVGEDFEDYRAWLTGKGVDDGGVRVIKDEHTASCFINTDLEDNQITAFYPGAMSKASTISPKDLGATPDDLVVIAPNDPAAMSRAAAECTLAGVPYLYDPSMQLPRMDKAQLEEGRKGAKILAGNDYEFGMMAEKLGITEDALRKSLPITVMTLGEKGALITVDGQEFEIPPAKPAKVVDPTGAGDAFRAGFVAGMSRKLPWPVVGRMASLTAVYAIEHPGTQEHAYSLDEFIARYRSNYGPAEELEVLKRGASA